MDKEYYLELARVRMMRAEELLEESKELLQRESYKSANNRAFYAIEKGLKALLATEEIEVTMLNKYGTFRTMMTFILQVKKKPDSKLKRPITW